MVMPIFAKTFYTTMDPWTTLTCQVSFESCLLCHLSGKKTRNFGQNLTLWGVCTHYPAPFTVEGKIWYDTADLQSTLYLLILS